MPTLAVTNFNVVCSTLGGFITLFGLVSFLFKERFYLSEALISLLAGVVFSPHVANFIKPLAYAGGSQENLEVITLYFTRLVLGVQLVLAGVQLPSQYLLKEWKSLALLLGPGMTAMWLCSSLIIWGLVPNLSFLHALAVGACVTPTDPVLSNSIVKGKFADKNIPKDLQRIIIAESGANDGLGYPFLFLALYIIKYTGNGGAGQAGGARLAMAYWFGETWGYVIILSVLYGAAVGWVAKELLHFAEERKFVDRESFLVFAIALALFILGTCGMIGSDDVLACFVAGNVFTWDDWFRLETLDDSLQPTIDMLLNLSIFMWFGAVCPWDMFVHNQVIPIYRLIVIGVLILLFRRVPIVYAMHWKIPQVEEKQQALFVGFFGPIGVSAVFYLYVTLEFLKAVTVDGVVREDAARLGEVMTVVIWFLAICSIIVHGLSVPLGKLGYRLPRTISFVRESRAIEEPEIFRVRERGLNEQHILRSQLRPLPPRRAEDEPARPVFRPGGSIIRPGVLRTETPRECTAQVIKFEDITLTNSTSGTNGEAPAGRVEGGGAGESKDNVGSPEVGNGGAELKSVEQRK
ncbi:MAG: Na H antiporter [Lasallia pustulata]|uniref:Na H antiporter n=1 Tax=Lasallia pustulata TaxID=136370 RepID=A0A5M8PL22_9LECA|nr:MAG: Na H antiporter [Lasallia pustulata]